MSNGYVTGWSWVPRPTRQQIEERRRKEEEANKRELEDIDEQINWGYSQMRIIEAWLEQAIERNEASLSEQDSKRIDKALVVTRTGLKMLKKVVKSRAPQLDTAAWRENGGLSDGSDSVDQGRA